MKFSNLCINSKFQCRFSNILLHSIYADKLQFSTFLGQGCSNNLPFENLAADCQERNSRINLFCQLLPDMPVCYTVTAVSCLLPPQEQRNAEEEPSKKKPVTSALCKVYSDLNPIEFNSVYFREKNNVLPVASRHASLPHSVEIST